MSPRGRRAAAVWVATILAASPAIAGSPEAEALFQEGLRHMDAKQYSAACPLFEKSQALEPAVGSLYQLGDCYLALGRTGSAWTNFDLAAKMAAAQKDAAREKGARARAEALRASLVTITVVVEQEAPGMAVTVQDAALPRAVWGTPVPVDPGTFAVRATAPHKHPFEIPVTVRGEGTNQKITIPKLADDVEEPAPPPVPSPATPPAPSPGAAPASDAVKPAPEAETGNKWQKPTALVASGLGLVGIGIGSYFGLKSIAKHGDATSHCDATTCDDVGYAANNDALDAGRISTIAFLAGGVLLTGGLVLWFTAPDAKPKAAGLRVVPQVAPGWAGVAAGGRF